MSYKLFEFARTLIDKKEDFVVAKVVDTAGSVPRKKGAVLIMNKNGESVGTVGGGILEAESKKLCLKTFKTKEKSHIYEFKLDEEQEDALDMGCGGDAKIEIDYIEAADPGEFLDEFKLKSTAYIFGGGHVAYALEPVLRHIDFETVVIDDRSEFSNSSRFPYAEQTITVDSFKNAFHGLELDENSYIIIVTRGHRGDLEVLRDALKTQHAYLGMIGSRRKNEALFDTLRREGVDEKLISEVFAPIGLDIGAETPEEIAISIAAEIIKVRSEKI